MSVDLKKAQGEWEAQLKSQADRSDPEKEMVDFKKILIE